MKRRSLPMPPFQGTEYQKRRTRLRQKLHLAARGDRNAYTALSDQYFDCISDYLTLCGWLEPTAKRSRILDVLEEVWTRISYARRLSDFERMLAEALIHLADSAPVAQPRAPELLELARQLDPVDRFILCVTEFGDWAIRWVSLATSLAPAEVEHRLARVRCALSGLDYESLALDEVEVLEELSSKMGRKIGPREQSRLCAAVTQTPRILEFKANWLEARCALVEFRQDIRVASDDFRVPALTDLHKRITLAQLKRPRMVENVLNCWKFSAYPELKTG